MCAFIGDGFRRGGTSWIVSWCIGIAGCLVGWLGNAVFTTRGILNVRIGCAARLCAVFMMRIVAIRSILCITLVSFIVRSIWPSFRIFIIYSFSRQYLTFLQLIAYF